MKTPWQTINAAPQEYGAKVLLWIPYGEDPMGSGYYAIGMWGPDPALDGGLCWIHPDEHYWLGEPSHWIPLKPPEQTMSKVA